MDETTVISLVERTQKPLFGFVLSLTSTGRQKAFEVAVASYVGALSTGDPAPEGAGFLRLLFRSAIRECRGVPLPTGPDLSGHEDLQPPKKEQVRLIKKSLFGLSFDQKCLLLLRDQQHLAYEDIAAILDMPAKEIRSKVLEVRDALRGKMKSLLA